MVSQILICLLVVVEAFLLGSIPWGVVLSRILMKDDVRSHGSGNIGTTNMMRTYGKKLGIACFLLDFAKAIVACALADFIGKCAVQMSLIPASLLDFGSIAALATFACVMGHIFSPWLQFKGGKGIAAGVACVFMTFGPTWALIEIALFALLTIVTRYVSLGSLAAAVLFFILSFVCYGHNLFAAVLLAVTAAVVIWAHRENIKRLLNGTENKVGSKKKA